MRVSRIPARSSPSSSPRRLHRLGAAAAVPALLVTLGACGSGDGDTATDPGGDAAPAAYESGDAVPNDEFADLVSTAVENATAAHVTMEVSAGSAGSMSAEGDADYSTTPLTMSMTMSVPGAGGAMDLLLVDGTMYLKPPAGSGGKYWALDLAEAENLPPGMSGMLEQMDPLKSVEAFGKALQSVEYEGSEEVDGNTLDRYQLTVDTAEIAQLGDMEEQGVDLPETVDYELWLDDEGLMRRLETAFEVQGQQLEVEVTLDDWGQDVSIEAPPKSRVTDFPGAVTS